jgi:Fe-S oxidoreductase
MWNTLAGICAGGNDPFAQQLQRQLDGRHKQPSHICEVTWDLIQRGALTLDAEANDHRVVTFHDSCNVARASRMGDAPGGQFEIPSPTSMSKCAPVRRARQHSAAAAAAGF